MRGCPDRRGDGTAKRDSVGLHAFHVSISLVPRSTFFRHGLKALLPEARSIAKQGQSALSNPYSAPAAIHSATRRELRKKKAASSGLVSMRLMKRWTQCQGSAAVPLAGAPTTYQPTG